MLQIPSDLLIDVAVSGTLICALSLLTPLVPSLDFRLLRLLW